MSRRLLGPVGGPFAFVLIAALVFTGLGWVTVAALRVEEAQREAAARAELGNNLRVALWRLDGRMLPALGVEDSRPFSHYESADPLSGSTAGPTPLLAAPLPDWMKLHVQIDPALGWDSPQVLAPDAAARVTAAWPELPLRNTTADRAATLAFLRAKYPAPATCELLAARERAMPGDGRPFAAPWFDPRPPEPVAFAPPADSIPKPPPPPEMVPIHVPAAEKPSEPFKLFGWDLARRDALATNLRGTGAPGGRDHTANAQAPAPPAQVGTAKPPAFPPAAAPPGGAVVRGGNSPTENERQMLEFRNRLGPIARGVQEAKNAGQEFPQYGRGGPQNTANSANWPSQVPAGKDKDAPPDPGSDPMKRADEALKRLRAEPVCGSWFEQLVALCRELDRQCCLDEVQRAIEYQHLRGAGTIDLTPFETLAVWLALGATGGERVPAPRPVPPAQERPAPIPQTANFAPPTNTLLNNFQPFNTLVGPPGINIHLGSMRPQWITAADGTETLALVRAAKLDAKTVYQGVILDWNELQKVLKDEVKDLFPDAKLVPVHTPAGVSPDRAMTALPVQLDPGPAPAPPAAGWTPLRLGLVLAWVAALVAFAAVGFSGWSLIDLAERRIRFVSAVTHELRTPLTSLRLYLDLLMSGLIHDEAKRQEYLNTLATESDRLHRLIDNVLDFAKLEKRARNGDLKPVPVGDLIDQLRRTWTDRLAADGREFVVVSTVASQTDVVTDAAMVHQIVGNLIDNARKYARDAEDKRIWLWARPGGPGRVVFEVEDRGPGVPVGERKVIFKPFRRGTRADATAGGAGLGLALAQQWAQVLGGTVAYRPAEGASGACFRLELPIK
jgi:signal transduction histidine kinase